MSDSFDAYYKWLGIPPEEQPPNHYRLLGVRLFESDLDVISNATDQRMTHIRTFQTGKHSSLTQHILNEVAAAKMCLLQPAKKTEYDAWLREAQKLAAQSASEAPSAEPATPAHDKPHASLAEDDSLLTLKPDPDERAPAPSSRRVHSQPVTKAAQSTIKDKKGKPVAVNLEDDLPLSGSDVLSNLEGSATHFPPQLPTYSGAGQQMPRWFWPAVGGAGVLVVILILLSAFHPHSGVDHPEPVATTEHPATAGQAPDVDSLLAVARQALARGSVDGAQNQLKTAATLARSPAERESVERLGRIADLLDEFWAAVHKTLNGLQGNEKLNVGGRELQIGSVAGESLTYRVGDANYTQSTSEMPTDLVVALASQSFSQAGPARQAAIGAFYAMDAGGDRKQAEAFWNAAREAGYESESLLPELSVPLAEERPRAQLPAAPASVASAGAASGPPSVEAASTPADALLRYVAGRHSDVPTPTAGGSDGTPFNDRPANGAILVGFEVSLTKTAPETISSLRPIFLTARGIQPGAAHGTIGDVQQMVANPGYAVGRIAVTADHRVQGMEIFFMRMTPTGLDGFDGYPGGFIGNDQPPRKMINEEGRPIDGIFGAVRDGVERLGMWTVATAKSPEPPPAMVNVTPGASPAGPNAGTNVGLPPSAPGAGPTSPSAAELSARLPVPEPAELKRAEKMIDDLFHEDFAETKTSIQKVSLAERLTGKAQKTSDDPAARYVLWVKASRLAAQAGDSRIASAAISDLAANFVVDELSLQLDVLAEADKWATTAPQKRQIVDDTLEMIDRAARDNDYAMAEKLVDVARRASRRAGDSTMAQRINDKEDKLQQQRQAYDKVKWAFAALKSKPTDAKANLAVGLYLCSVWNDWEQGLPHLAQGSDAKLREVVEEDVKAPTLAPEQAKLADAWWEIASASPDFAGPCRRRARYWYLMAVPHLEGIARTKVEKRVEESLGSHGLRAEFFKGKDFSQHLESRVDANVDFSMAVNPPGTDVSQSEFSVRWTGYMVAPVPGQYELTFDHTDGGRIFLDNHLIVDGWTGARRQSATVNFGSKPKPIRVELQRITGVANAVLSWAQKNGQGETSANSETSTGSGRVPAGGANPAEGGGPQMDPSLRPSRPGVGSAVSSGVEQVVPVDAFYRDKTAAQQGFAPP